MLRDIVIICDLAVPKECQIVLIWSVHLKHRIIHFSCFTAVISRTAGKAASSCSILRQRAGDILLILSLQLVAVVDSSRVVYLDRTLIQLSPVADSL